MSLYFRPEKGVLGDVIPFYDNGVFKPFYLRNYRGNRDANHQDSWVMLSTTDHVHFTEHDTKIVGGTGSVIKVDGIYHMFFCTFQVMPEKNYILSSPRLFTPGIATLNFRESHPYPAFSNACSLYFLYNIYPKLFLSFQEFPVLHLLSPWHLFP